ncbi:MAG: hypothetical protein HN428_08680 [Proteobacteria bacterium]|jgi:hypothetical protein|nr:hypothetical protein [Pseudomonadota bacterium]MBT6599987.1 hypothetical protein [Bacteroidetes Order II. bacterium]|tara:strand:- start:667 stop:927 length:261 start_codon:yes stop_codon:yes gene_type:complete
MADFPLAINVQGDYGYKVIVVDDAATIAEVISTSVEQIVSVLVAPFPEGTVLRARIHGADEPLANGLKVGDANFVQMEALEIYVEP